MGETFQYFKEQTSLEVMAQIRQYQDEAVNILANITDKELQYQSQQFNNISTFTNMVKFTNDSSIMRDQLLQARAELGLTGAYIEGYKFLNKVGHYFNSKDGWNYSVTLFGRENVTFQMSEDDFLSLGEAHLSGFKLIGKKTSILEKMRDTQNLKGQVTEIQWKNDLTDTSSKYNKALYDSYKNIITYARAILIRGGSSPKYNEGQILEGYLAFGEKINRLHSLVSLSEKVERAKNKHLGDGDFSNLSNFFQQQIDSIQKQIEKQTNSRGFWTGGDTSKEGQIKGEGASIFSYETITNQLQKFIQITGQLKFDKLQMALEKQIKPKARSALEKTIEETIAEIISSFNATRTNIGSLTKLSNLSSEIDSILSAII